MLREGLIHRMVSVGVALVEGLDGALVMAHADLAMFEARQALPQPGNDGI